MVEQATRLSLPGYLQILQREAFVPVAYADGIIGGASNYGLGFGVGGHKPGDTITLPEALVRFKKAADERAEHVLQAVKVPLTQDQLNALTSLYFQGGTRKLGPIVDLLNGGWWKEAVALWNTDLFATTGAGEFRQGLKDRRKRESSIFELGDYGDIGWFWEYDGNPKSGASRTRHDLTDVEKAVLS